MDTGLNLNEFKDVLPSGFLKGKDILQKDIPFNHQSNDPSDLL